jgi:hypothetical protein
MSTTPTNVAPRVDALDMPSTRAGCTPTPLLPCRRPSWTGGIALDQRPVKVAPTTWPDGAGFTLRSP